MITTCLPGERYGHLIVLAEAKPQGSPRKRRCVSVKCDCGVERIVHAEALRSGNTKSCGCYRRKLTSQRRTTHGDSGTPLHTTWKNMNTRCNNPNSTGYQHYGGRGIRVCQAWRKFNTFRSWALTNGYAGGLMIEREDNNKNYAPSNCRWATPRQQNLHKQLRTGRSGYLGVQSRRKRYAARVCMNYKRIHLGTFDDPFSAAWVRDEFVTQLYEHATTNNLVDRRKRKKLVMFERRGTFKRRQI